MKKCVGILVLGAALIGCGAASPPPPDDDVTEEWTSGDDEALDPARD